MNAEFILALEEIEKEKGISKEVILNAVEAALIFSYKKNFGSTSEAEVDIDRETGEVKVYSIYEIVETEDDIIEEENQITLEEAKKINNSYEIGDIVRKETTPIDFGRIAAQTARQVVIQRIKDAERDVIYNEYISRENEVITGVIQRFSNNNLFVDLGKTEAMLPYSEQIKTERYNQGMRLKLLLQEVKKTTKGPQIIISRANPDLVKRLFELEVPEIQEGIVLIHNISREAGSRTKIAVSSRDEDVDPLGACVGYQGARVKLIVDELNGEKIDIIIWSKDMKEYIANSLSPSEVTDVFLNEEEESAIVIVPDHQLSLAIGKEGQNARLAAKLTNWKIDIKSESQFEEESNNIDLNTEELESKVLAEESVEDIFMEDKELNTDFDLDESFNDIE